MAIEIEHEAVERDLPPEFGAIEARPAQALPLQVFGARRMLPQSALPWTRSSPYRRREIIQGASDATTGARPMRANARAILIEALGNAHRWLDDLLSDPRQTPETLASREGKTERSIRMTVSLAFLAPDIVKAAVEGRLPRGYGLKRLIDLPLAWPDQW